MTAVTNVRERKKMNKNKGPTWPKILKQTLHRHANFSHDFFLVNQDICLSATVKLKQ